LVDLDHLNSDPALFYDDCHFNEAGARAVAEAVAETLLSSAPGLFEH
jgi:lysophospholipase L1-like esterase